MDGFTSRRFDLQCWEDDKRVWHYDGPAASGPRQVRTSGHGPYWRGSVTRQFVVTLRDKLRAIESER